IGVTARGLDLEAGPVARRAIVPVELYAAVTARTRGALAAARVPLERRLGAAPGARLHEFRDPPRALPALVARVERLTVLALELAEQHRLPLRRLVGGARAACRALLLRGTVANSAELAVHRHGVGVAILRTHLDGAPQPIDELGLELGAD